MQHLDVADGNADEEKAAESATPRPPSTSAQIVDASPAIHHRGSSSIGHAEMGMAEANSGDGGQNPFQRRESDEASNESRSTGTSAPTPSVPHLPLPNSVVSEASPSPSTSPSISIPTSAAAASSTSHSPTPARGKSLKRKPVPALLEPFDASQLPNS
ncbi:hypothetical protein [Sporisorium scitamineum]|nr:hypothetical protein [Sporisorium scitamineum]